MTIAGRAPPPPLKQPRLDVVSCKNELYFILRSSLSDVSAYDSRKVIRRRWLCTSLPLLPTTNSRPCPVVLIYSNAPPLHSHDRYSPSFHGGHSLASVLAGRRKQSKVKSESRRTNTPHHAIDLDRSEVD
jgi:hypothetical protein